MEMMVNWNAENNRLSEAVLDGGLLENLLDELGCCIRSRSGSSFRGRCPVHGGDGQNFVVVADGRTLPVRWACHSHHCERAPGLKESLLGLVRGALSGDPGRLVPLPEALVFLQDFVRRSRTSTSPRPTRRAPAPTRRPLALNRDQVRSALTIPSPYFLARGFDPAVLDALDVGDSAKLGRAVAPVYDDGRVCVGFVSRSVGPDDADGQPRWKFPTGFAKGDYLFNYAAARSSCKPFVLLVEGVPDVLRAAEAGVPAVACFGTDLTDYQAIKLAHLGKTVVVAFDNDDAGRKGAVAAAQSLRECRLQVEVRHPPEGFKDVGDMSPAGVGKWLADAVAPNLVRIGR